MVLLFVVCGWREKAVAGVCRRTYSVHSTYVLFCTSATISLFRAKPTVNVELGKAVCYPMYLPSGMTDLGIHIWIS